MGNNTPNAKFHVSKGDTVLNLNQCDILFHESNKSIKGTVNQNETRNIGVWGQSWGNQSLNIGIYGMAGGVQSTNIGVLGVARNNCDFESYALYGLVQDCDSCSEGNSVGVKIGVRAYASQEPGRMAAFFNGDVGFISPAYQLSDEKTKKDFAESKDVKILLNKIQIKNYHNNSEKYPGLSFAIEKQLGFTAQDVEKSFLHLVKEINVPENTNNGTEVIHTFKAVNYNGFVPILVKGFQELSDTDTKFEEKLNDLKHIIFELKNRVNETNHEIGLLESIIEMNNKLIDQLKADIEVICKEGCDKLGDSTKIRTPILFQNAPNPFNEQTAIKCYLPNIYNRATLTIFSTDGKQLKQVILNGNGYITIMINANELTAGIFYYTLYVDNIEIDTKKMILTH